MDNKKLTVLYIAIDPSLGGSTSSLWNMIDSMKEEVNPIVIFPSVGVGYDFLKEHGVDCYVFPFNILYQLKKNSLLDVWKHPWRWHYIKKLRCDLACLSFVKKILRGRKADIVHTNTSPNDVGVLLSKALHAKHVWHVREFGDLDFHMEMYDGYDSLRKKINGADARIAISSVIAKHWQMKEENTFVINNAIRSKADAVFVQDKEKYVLFSSYFLTKPKGTLRAIEAFDKSRLADEGFTLKLMGNIKDGFEDELMQTITATSCQQSIEFIPCQKNVKPYFAKASAFIMASDFEGLGRVTAEAMFYGCPVIARANGGTLDIVKDGETGYLFNTVDECASLLRKVCLTDQTDMILRAQHFACTHLSQEVYGPKIMKVYKKVMD
ncbi:MAG: glycosyltransferase [Bacteroidia bacterium]|nr:glycosyltransferase [Bacteroidia bacterium]